MHPRKPASRSDPSCTKGDAGDSVEYSSGSLLSVELTSIGLEPEGEDVEDEEVVSVLLSVLLSAEESASLSSHH